MFVLKLLFLLAIGLQPSESAVKARVKVKASPEIEASYFSVSQDKDGGDINLLAPVYGMEKNLTKSQLLLDLKDDGDNVAAATTLPTARGTVRSRVFQSYIGLRVFGVSCAMEFDAAGNPTGEAFGHVIKGIKQDVASTETRISGDRALEILKLAAKITNPGYTLGKQDSEKVIYINGDGRAVVAWHSYFTAYSPDGTGDRKPVAIIDGDGGEILEMWEGFDTVMVQARVGNTRGPASQKLHDIDVYEAEDGVCFYRNPKAELMDMQGEALNTQWEFVVRGFPCDAAQDDRGFDYTRTAISPMNDVFLSSTYTHDMFLDYLGISPLDNGTHSQTIKARVHVNGCYDNAYWDGDYVNVGDGCQIYYPLSSIDIVAHEIAHGFTDYHSDLKYKGESGGIDESFSDIVGETVEYYFRQKTGTGTNDWLIGANIQTNGEPLRYMNDPPRDRISIDHVDDYFTGYNVHYTSGIFNKAFYLLSTRQGWDIVKAFRVFARANMVEWEQDTTFHCAACGLRNAAFYLGYGSDDVDDALSSVGALCSSCD